MRTSALIGAKNIGFFVIDGVTARTKGWVGWASADILRIRREGSTLCRRRLWTAS